MFEQILITFAQTFVVFSKSQLSLFSFIFYLINTTTFLILTTYVLVFWLRFVFKKTNKKNNPKPFNQTPSVTFLIPVHTEEPDCLKECFQSINQLNYQGSVNVWILPSKNISFSHLNSLFPKDPSNRFFSIKDFNCLSKGDKIRTALNEVTSEYVAIIDADCTCHPNWLKDSLQAIHDDGDNCIGSQSLRQIKGKQNFIVQWDSFVSHFCHEVLNRLRIRKSVNIPFTGTGALFKTKVFKDIPFEAHYTEDTHWFMKLRLNTAQFMTYQGQSAIYEYLPNSLSNFIHRRLRWATGHNQSFFTKKPWRHLFKIDHMIHGSAFTAAAFIFISLTLRSIFVLMQLNTLVQILIILLLSWAVWKKVHLLIAFIPVFILITSSTMNISLFSVSQDILFAHEMSSLSIYIALSHFAVLIIAGIKMNLFKSRYFLPLIMAPFFIILETYASFISFFSLKSKKSTWNSYQSKKWKKLNFLIILSIIFLILAPKFFLLKNFIYHSNSLFSNDISDSPYPIEIDGKNLYFNQKPFKIHGISVNSNVTKDDLERLSQAGFNTLRFYYIPSDRLIEQAKKFNLKVLIQPDVGNWNNLSITSLKGRLLFEINFLTADHLIKKHSNILFPIIGNEADLWPYNIHMHSLLKQIDKKKVPETLMSIFKKYNDRNYIFAYSTVYGATPLSFKNVPIPMVNTNELYFEDWEKIEKGLKLKPILVSEYGGRAPYTIDNKLFFEPDFIKNYLIKRNHGFFSKKNLVGQFFFALKDVSFSYKMLKYSDPFLLDEENRVGVFNIKDNPKDEFWLLSDLQNKIKIQRGLKENFFLVNESQKAIEVTQINNSKLNLRLNNQQKIRISQSLFSKNSKNTIEFKQDNKFFKKNLFHGDGYINACPVKTSYKIKLSSERGSYIINLSKKDQDFTLIKFKRNVNLSLKGYIRMRLFSPNEILLYRIPKAKKHKIEVRETDRNQIVGVENLKPCRQGSPFIAN